MGNIIPYMGVKKKSISSFNYAGLASALFTTTQQRVLGIIFGQPSRSFYANELIGLAAGGAGAVQRELKRLTDAQLVVVTKIGNQKHYQANQSSPLFEALSDIVMKTMGLADPLRSILGKLENRIDAAFVYGSVGKGTDTARSDIDLMVISDTLEYANLYSLLEPVSVKLGRTINPTIYSRSEWLNRLGKKNAFVEKVMSQKKIWLMGEENVLKS